jgi:hypothetical protein
MAIDYAKIIDDLKGSILGPVKAAAKDLLASNKDAADFIEERGRRIAELGVDYIKAGSDSDRAAALLQIQVVRQAIQSEIASVAVNASVASRETFQRVLATALDVVIKVLPIIVSAL